MDLLTTDEAAEYLHIPLATLRTWIAKGTAPKSARFGKRRLFLRSEIDAFIAAKFADVDVA